jgi:uncharacterized protein
MSLFGSVLRDDFDASRSDIDVLVELDPAARTGFLFFGYGAELAEILGRRVDLNTPAMLSRYFRDEVQVPGEAVSAAAPAGRRPAAPRRAAGAG